MCFLLSLLLLPPACIFLCPCLLKAKVVPRLFKHREKWHLPVTELGIEQLSRDRGGSSRAWLPDLDQWDLHHWQVFRQGRSNLLQTGLRKENLTVVSLQIGISVISIVNNWRARGVTFKGVGFKGKITHWKEGGNTWMHNYVKVHNHKYELGATIH